MSGRTRSLVWSLIPVALVLVTTAATLYHVRTDRPELVLDRPIEVHSQGYVSSETCRSCHPHQYDTWHDSYHRTMTQVATPEAVVGNFDQVGVSLYERVESGAVVEQKFVFGRSGDEFWVEMDDPEGRGTGPEPARVREPIVMTTGSHHMQVYWYASGEGRMLELSPFVFLIPDQRWVPFGSVFLKPSSNQVPRGAARWNRTCITCHTTKSQPRLSQRGYFDSYVAEFGIACEACHGPGEEHVAANRNPERRYLSHLTGGGDDTIVDPRELPNKLRSQACGQCHGILFYHDTDELYAHYTGDGASYVPGANLHESRVVVQPTKIEEQPILQEKVVKDPEFVDGHFWRDGMVRVSGREFNMLEQSPCYRGDDFACVSCHALHQPPDDERPRKEWANDQLLPGMDGDQACMQCHAAEIPDVSAHTHHEASSSGSRCLNCHMPYTSYGQLKAIRSHQISSPTATESVEVGRPNACNLCHLDQSLGWTATYLEQWYETPSPALTNDQEEIAASALWSLTGDAGLRALMAFSMGWEDARTTSGEDWTPAYLIPLLDDPYAAIRYITYRSLKRYPGFADFEYDYLSPQSVREGDVRRALDVWNRTTPPSQRTPREAALIGEDGRVRVTEFERLRVRRDDRYVSLQE